MTNSDRPPWHLYILVALSTALPMVVAMSILASPLVELDEPVESVATPNPAKAPGSGKSRELLVLVGPSFARFAGQWFYLTCVGTLVWIALAPRLAWGIFQSGHYRSLKLIVASIGFGTVLAWPWYFAILGYLSGLAT